jgi:hypothetical protein
MFLFLFKLFFNILNPAYLTFKAFRSRRAHHYVKWMMYWIVFALFSAFETIADIFLFWLPFYYEIKFVFLVWLILPVWKDLLGSGLLYEKFVHPWFLTHEPGIDSALDTLQRRTCSAAFRWALKAIKTVSDFIVDQAWVTLVPTPTQAPENPTQAPESSQNVFSSDSEPEEQQQQQQQQQKKAKKAKKGRKVILLQQYFILWAVWSYNDTFLT